MINGHDGGEVMIRIEKLERALSQMPDKALIRLIKRCICKSMLGIGAMENEERLALDMVYVECSRRGKERLYDTAYASVSSHPERCNIF